MDGPNKFLNALGSNYMNSTHIDRVIQWMLDQQKELPIFFLAVRGRPDVIQVNKQLPVTELVSRFKNAASISPADTIAEFKKICLVLGFIPPPFYLASKNGTVPPEFRENLGKAKDNELYSEEAMKRFRKIEKLLDKKAYAKLAKDSLLSAEQWERMGSELDKLATRTKEITAIKTTIEEAEANKSNLEAIVEQTNKKMESLLKSAKVAQQNCQSDPSDVNKTVFNKLKKDLKKVKKVSGKLGKELLKVSESIETLSSNQFPVHAPIDVLFADPFEADVFVTDLFYKTQSSKGGFTKRYRRFNNRTQNNLIKVLQDLNASEQKPAEYSEAIVAVKDLVFKTSDRIHTQMARDFAADAATQLFRCENDPEFAMFPVLPIRNLISSNIHAGKEDLAAQKKQKEKASSSSKNLGTSATGVDSANDLNAEIDALLGDDSSSDDSDNSDDDDDDSNNFSLSLSKSEEGGEEEEEEREAEPEKKKIQAALEEEPKGGKKRKREEEPEPEKTETPSTPAKKRAKKTEEKEVQVPQVVSEKEDKKEKKQRTPAKKRERKEEKEETKESAAVPTEDAPLKKRGKKSKKKSTPTRKSPPPIKTDDVSFEDFYESVLEHYGFENKDDLIETPKNGAQIDAIESALLAVEHEDYHRIFHEPFPKLTLTPTRDDRDSALTAIRQRGQPHTIRPSVLLQCGHVALHLNRIPRSIAVSIRDNAKVTEENYEDALVEYLHSTEGICNLSTALLQIEDSVNILTSYYGQTVGGYQVA